MRTVDLERLEAAAAPMLEPAARAYIERGAASDDTRDANAAAWRALRLRPRVLRNVTEVSTETTVVGVGLAAPVLVDGGIRSGVGVLRALALGAHAVMIGRPVLWGLALDGESGARDVLTSFAQDLRRAMVFCGAASLADIDRDLLTS